MRITTLVYAKKDGKYLVMNRNRKEQDENAGKWIGLGGHLEAGESPRECVEREAMEEAGICLHDLRLRGILTFILPAWGDEMTFLYTAKTENSAKEGCDEGDLRWVTLQDLMRLPLWAGDRIFLPLLENGGECFDLKLIYDRDGNLTEWILDGGKKKTWPAGNTIP